MRNLRKKHPARALTLVAVIIAMLMTVFAAGCSDSGSKDQENQKKVSAVLEKAQPTPTDIAFSLERYNLIKRAYWVNGLREKALAYPCEIAKPLGYIVLFTDNGAILNKFVVDGKVSCLTSYLTPQSEWFEGTGGEFHYENNWLADVDGSYGDNDGGIFFFTPDGKYLEYKGNYLYSDIPFEISDPILKVQNNGGN